MQTDPLDGIRVRPATQHPYLYAFANPVNFTDRLGFFLPSPGDLLESVKSGAEKLVESASGTAAGVVEKTKSGAKRVGSTVSRTVSSALSGAKEIAGDVYSGGQQVVERVVSTTRTAVNKTREAVSTAYEAGTAAVKDVGSNAVAVVDQAVETANEVAETVGEVVAPIAEATVDFVKDNWVEIAVGIAAFSACVAGIAAVPFTAGASTVVVAVGCGAFAGAVGGIAGNAARGNTGLDLLDGVGWDIAIGGVTAGVGKGLGSVFGKIGSAATRNVRPGGVGNVFRGGGGARAAAGHACSFSAGTGVLMADGATKPISEVEVGDEVLAKNPETGEGGAGEVTHLWVHQDNLVDLEFDGAVVATTEDHPFWNVTDSEWQRADALGIGDFVLTAAGGLLEVDGIDWRSARTATAYNLTVDGVHTYFVQAGDIQVLVHNTCPRGLWKLTREAAESTRRHGRFGTFYESVNRHGDSMWLANDTAKHGGSAFKMYEETSRGLRWVADLDKYGDIIVGKHKSEVGSFIPWREFGR